MSNAAADPVYEDIRAMILAGELAPGSPLRQDEIAKRFGISKIPVREALRRFLRERRAAGGTAFVATVGAALVGLPFGLLPASAAVAAALWGVRAH